MANASGTAEVGLLNLMKHKMSRGTFNEGHEPSKSAEAEGPYPESEETKAESKENEESESEKTEHGKNEPDAGDESLKLLSDKNGGPGKGSAFSDGTEKEIPGNLQEYTEDEQDGNRIPPVTSLKQLFVQEWDAFKRERATSWSEKKQEETVLSFEKIRLEWDQTENPDHWVNQAKKQDESHTCCPLFYSILVGILFVVVPNGAILLDMLAASDYLGGQWYLKRENEVDSKANNSCLVPPPTLTEEQCCRRTGQSLECFERDPLWGTLTLLFLFIPGIFWSLGIFIQFASYLRKKDPEKFNQKRFFFFFFLPAAALCAISFPLQLMTVSVIATFNTQDQWTILTSKIGIAEGFFNAHFQYLLQLFVFFLKADRHPSLVQYGAAFGSLLFLVWSRVESLLADRKGHTLSPGQKIWWLLRFGPIFLFNSAFKLASISLIFAILRYNAIWIYVGMVIFWLLLQFLFNQQYLPKKFYFLFVGAGMHACSIAHIQETVKLVKTRMDSRQNELWVSRLTSSQLKMNMWCQNIIWFIFNSITITLLWYISTSYSSEELSILWPFFEKSFTFSEVKVVRVLHIVVPSIITLGVISLLLLCFMEFKATTTKDTTEVSIAAWMENYPNWVPTDQTSGEWRKFKSDNVKERGLIGCLSRTTFPLMNIWQNAMDKNVI